MRYDFVQISPACGPNTYQIIYEETSKDYSTTNVSVSNGNIKRQIGKSIFAVDLPLERFRSTFANADTGSKKSLSIHY